jgi:hypothetical protein
MSVRIGVVGPAADDVDGLRSAASRLLQDVGADQVIYLGVDDAMDRVVGDWAVEVMGSKDAAAAFLERAARLALQGTPDAIRSLLEADARLQRLRALRRLPPPPARAVEMIEDRIVIAVHDKAILDEEDIANAHVIVYGKGSKPLIKKFGPRCFFTPGPLSEGHVGVIEVERDGRMAIQLCDVSGKQVWKEHLQGRGPKIMVSG